MLSAQQIFRNPITTPRGKASWSLHSADEANKAQTGYGTNSPKVTGL